MEVTRAAKIGVQLLGTVDGAEPEVDTLAVLTVGSMCLNAGGISKENITLAFDADKRDILLEMLANWDFGNSAKITTNGKTMDETKVKQDNLSILIAARERIADPEHWCQGSLARDVDGEMCGYGEKEAVRWCASGSVWKEAALAGIINKRIVHDENHTAVYCSMAFSHLSVAAHQVGNGRHTAEVNDELGHGFVLEMYDKAIGCLKADLKQRGI